MFSAFAAPAAAQVSRLFPLDHFWTNALDAPFAAAPASDGTRVYVPLQTGQLVALAPGTNTVAWSVELAVEGAPLAAEGRVFVPAAGAIHALDASTGTLEWRLPAGPLAAPLAHRGGWLIVAPATGGLQGVRSTDGVVVWARDTGSPLVSAPAIDGDLLVAALADGRIAAMDVTTGHLRWQRTLSAPAGSVAVSGDRIFAGTADGKFWSLKTRNGDPDWKPWRLGARLIGAAVADDERIYAVALDNVVRAFSRRTGNVKWTRPLSSRPLAGPRLVDGLLILTAGDIGAPGLTYIDAATGVTAGRTPALPAVDPTTRVQFEVALDSSSTPLAVIATATTSGDWQLHAFRQTYFVPTIGAITWGRLYEIRRRLDYAIGAIIWGNRVPLVPPVPLVP